MLFSSTDSSSYKGFKLISESLYINSYILIKHPPSVLDGIILQWNSFIIWSTADNTRGQGFSRESNARMNRHASTKTLQTYIEGGTWAEYHTDSFDLG